MVGGSPFVRNNLLGVCILKSMDERSEIKERLTITEVVQSYLPLKQAGRSLKAPCPFHQEKSASFMVNPERGIYHCFGCNEGGDIFSFVMKMEGLDFREALEKLARQAGVELKARRGEDAGVSKKRDRALEAHELAVRYFQASLVQNQKALDYAVKKRGLSRQTIKDFQIGYAPDSWNALTDFLGKKGFSNSELLAAGLAGQKQGRTTIYDLFRGRLTFTICDRDGRPIGFTARVLDDSLPKYLNTPQTPLYDKSRAIFGLHLAREAIRASNEVVLVEGNMDVVASHQAGVKQVVAASGTALTLDQLRSLSKLTKTIKLAFDTDRAGLAATERAIELGQQLGLTLRMVVLKDAKDADELIAKDPRAWSLAIAEAKYIVDYLFERFESDFDLSTAMGKRQYTDRLISTLRRLGDPVEQDHYVKLLAEKVGTNEKAIIDKLAQSEEAKDDKPAQRAVELPEMQEPPDDPNDLPNQPLQRKKLSPEEAMTVRLMDEFLAINLTEPLARGSLQDVSAAYFDGAERKEVFSALADHGSEAQEAILSAISAKGYVDQLTFIAEQEYKDKQRELISVEIYELSQNLQRRIEKRWMSRLKIEISHAVEAGDAKLRDELLVRFQNLASKHN
jgi:DNA primase